MGIADGLAQVMQALKFGARRRHTRYECRIKALLELDNGRRFPGFVVDISQGGARFSSKGPEVFFAGASSGYLQLASWRMKCKIVGKSSRSFFCSFEVPLSQRELQQLEEAQTA